MDTTRFMVTVKLYAGMAIAASFSSFMIAQGDLRISPDNTWLSIGTSWGLLVLAVLSTVRLMQLLGQFKKVGDDLGKAMKRQIAMAKYQGLAFTEDEEGNVEIVTRADDEDEP